MSGQDRSGPTGAGGPDEEELRAAYEAELSRITVTDMVAQSAVSLLNLAARRLAPGAAGAAQPPQGPPERDLEQVRDGIDAVRALLEILERRLPQEVRPLRDALSQLQIAYAAEVRAPAPGDAGGAGKAAEPGPVPEPAGEPSAAAGGPEQAGSGGAEPGPGPAVSSGRLWVPGR